MNQPLIQKINRKAEQYNLKVEPYSPSYLTPFVPKEHDFLNDSPATFFLQVTPFELNQEYILRLLFCPDTPALACLNLENQQIHHIIYENELRIDWKFNLQGLDLGGDPLQDLLYQPMDLDSRIWFLFDAAVRFFHLAPPLTSNCLDQIETELIPKIIDEPLRISEDQTFGRLVHMMDFYNQQTTLARNKDKLSVGNTFILRLLSRMKHIAP